MITIPVPHLLSAPIVLTYSVLNVYACWKIQQAYMVKMLVCRELSAEHMLSDCAAAEDDAVDDRCLVAVWDEGEGWNRLGDDQIGLLADSDRTELVADAHRVCCVDGAGVE